MDAAVLIPDYHFYSAEALFGIDSVSLVHIAHHSAEQLYKGEAAGFTSIPAPQVLPSYRITRQTWEYLSGSV